MTSSYSIRNFLYLQGFAGQDYATPASAGGFTRLRVAAAQSARIKGFIVAALLVLQTACSVLGIRSVESPKYKVLESEGNKEIRQYEGRVIAYTEVPGTFTHCQSAAFRILAGYIFGGNEKSAKISMTAPVVQSESLSEKIAMTAPVIQSPSATGWVMSFTMPSKYKLEDLPRPKDPRVQLRELPIETFAVIRFSGALNNEKRSQAKTEQLQDWLAGQGRYLSQSHPMLAGYDPPWTLPFLRRNEIMIKVIKK